MVNSIAERVVEVSDPLENSAWSSSLSQRQIIENLAKAVPSTECWAVSTLPRGGAQVAQPGKVNESLTRAYARDFHTEDAATWAIAASGSRKSGRAADLWPNGSFEDSRYYRDFMQPAGLRFLAIAPLEAPLLEGYA